MLFRIAGIVYQDLATDFEVAQVYAARPNHVTWVICEAQQPDGRPPTHIDHRRPYLYYPEYTNDPFQFSERDATEIIWMYHKGGMLLSGEQKVLCTWTPRGYPSPVAWCSINAADWPESEIAVGMLQDAHNARIREVWAYFPNFMRCWRGDAARKKLALLRSTYQELKKEYTKTVGPVEQKRTSLNENKERLRKLQVSFRKRHADVKKKIKEIENSKGVVEESISHLETKTRELKALTLADNSQKKALLSTTNSLKEKNEARNNLKKKHEDLLQAHRHHQAHIHTYTHTISPSTSLQNSMLTFIYELGV